MEFQPFCNGKVDHLIGLKENVIIGKLIRLVPVMKRYRNIKLSTGEIEDKIQEQEAPVAEEPQEETDAPLEEADKSFSTRMIHRMSMSDRYLTNKYIGKLSGNRNFSVC